MQVAGVFLEGTKGSARDFIHCAWKGAASKIRAHTWYQIPLTTFLVADPLRNPRVSGRPIATTGFLGMSKRTPGRPDDMVKVKKSKRVKGLSKGRRTRSLHP
jgi:hypothetical protein